MYITFRDCWPGVARRLPLRGSAGCVRLLPRPDAVRRPAGWLRPGRTRDHGGMEVSRGDGSVIAVRGCRRARVRPRFCCATGWPIRGCRRTCSRGRRASWDCASWRRTGRASAGPVPVAWAGSRTGWRMPSWSWTRCGVDAAALLGVSRRAGRSQRRARPGLPGRVAQPHAQSRRSARQGGPPAGWRLGSGCRWQAARRAPGFGGWFLGRLAALARRSPRLFLRLATSELPGIDRRALGQPGLRDPFLANYDEAFRQGSRGVAQDLRVLTRPWGFELGSIQVPALDPPRGCGHDGPAPARPAVRRGDTGRTASALPRPRPLLDPRRRPGDARTARSIELGQRPRGPARAARQVLTGTGGPPPPPRSCPARSAAKVTTQHAVTLRQDQSVR